MDRQETGNVTEASQQSTGGRSVLDKPLTRRKALKYGLLGAAGLAGAGAVVRYLWRSGRAEAAADVFKNDAPKGKLWQAWQDRGWTKEAHHYRSLGANVQCKVCPNECLLEPEDRGRCRNKVNKDGTLYTLAYGNPCSYQNDPIEKKPLYHFLPGTWSFSIATSGCGFRCLNCQNWSISQRKPEETKDPRGEDIRLTTQRIESLEWGDLPRISMFPEDVIVRARHLGSKSIAYTYSEPTSYFEYMYDTAKLARREGIKNVWVTCGYITAEALTDLCQYLDAANVDLKSFDDVIYRKLNSGQLQPILDTLKMLKARDVWFEVTNLIVPTYTDRKEMVRRMCDWLVENIGPDYPLHFSRFHPAHKLTHLPPTPQAKLIEARSIARQAGMRYVYIGNAPEVEQAGTTFCPGCGKPIIERRGYRIESLCVTGGKCDLCGQKIAGVWS